MTSKLKRFLGLLALFASLMAFGPALADALVTPYTPQNYAEAKASGKPFLLDFYADWCVTCHAQDRVLAELQAENPAYKSILILRVDWDKEERGPFVAALKIPRRSTLLLIKGEEELVRIIAEANKPDMARMLDKAL